MQDCHRARLAPLVGGAERVLEQILLIFPQADIFASLGDPAGPTWISAEQAGQDVVCAGTAQWEDPI